MLIYGMMRSNSSVIEGGFTSFGVRFYDVLVARLLAYGRHLVDRSVSLKRFGDFTGNTVTSFACGVYRDGVLVGHYVADKSPALRKKVGKDEYVQLPVTYDGRKDVSVKGRVSVSDGYGSDFSLDFLRSFSAGGGLSLVVLTGTEYSLYIEQERDLNVLSATYALAGDVGGFVRFMGRFEL